MVREARQSWARVEIRSWEVDKVEDFLTADDPSAWDKGELEGE